MKLYKILLGGLLLASFASCDENGMIPETPETPEQPTESFQFTFAGSIDTDEETTRASWTDESTDKKLVFGWDYTNMSKPTYDMKMGFISPQGSPLKSIGNKNYTDVAILRHSTQKDNTHWAEFQTVERYSKEMKTYDGHTLIAVNGKGSTIKTNPSYVIELAMPNTITQSAENSLAHLTDYMYMYDIDIIKDGDAHLKFNHLTAPIRFRIHNWRPCEAKIYSVKMETTNGQAITSSAVSVTTNGATYSPNTHSAITVKAADNSYFTIKEHSQNEYIDLYAHVLPMAGYGIQSGDSIKFTIEASDIVTGENRVQYPTSELDRISAEKFENATGSYNWKAGYLYTFHMYLDDAIKNITISSVSIKEWEEEDLGTSEAM